MTRNVEDWQICIQVVYLGRDSIGHRCRRRRGTCHQEHVAGRVLGIRKIHYHPRIGIQAVFLHHAGDTHNGQPPLAIMVADMFANRISTRPKTFCQFFIHNHYRQASLVVVVGKPSAAKQRDLHRLEVSRGGTTLICLHLGFVRRRRIAFHLDTSPSHTRREALAKQPVPVSVPSHRPPIA